MNIILKKSLALVLVVVMIVGLFPHALYAGEAETGENTAPAALTPADTAGPRCEAGAVGSDSGAGPFGVDGVR